MDLEGEYKVVMRKDGSETDLMVIDKLYEAEAKVVFQNLKFPAIKENTHVKILIGPIGNMLTRYVNL